MITIGLTGGLGSGKSVVAKLFRLFGVPVYDSDSEAKKLMDNSAEIRAALVDLLGDEAYSNGTLNRPYIASRIFVDQHLLSAVNGIVHPAVRRDFAEWLTRQTSEITAIESAILFESGLADKVTYKVVVQSPVEVRIRRVSQRDGLSDDQIQQRIASQTTDEERLKKADFVIVNDESSSLIGQVDSILRNLCRLNNLKHFPF